MTASSEDGWMRLPQNDSDIDQPQRRNHANNDDAEEIYAL